MQAAAFELASGRGLPLRGDLLSPDPAEDRPVVVICHGFKGFKNWGFFPYLGERLVEAGNHCVLFNFSGSGIGPGLQNFTELERFAKDTISRQVDDLGTILEAVLSGELALPGAQPSTVGVLGHSRGGAVALIRASEDRRVRAAVTWSSISSVMRWSERELTQWKEKGYMEFLNTRTNQMMRIDYSAVEDWQANRERFDVTRAIAALDAPALIVHGEEDLGVHVREARALYAAADASRCALQIVPNTGHTFGAVHPWQGSTEALELAIDRTIGWFRTHLVPGDTNA